MKCAKALKSVPHAGAGDSLLSIRGLRVRFGGVLALEDVSFDVGRGCITGLIGPNGSGKTTLFNCLSRLCDYREGSVSFDGKALEQMPSHRMAGLGIGRTFQNLALFSSMSVLDNIKVGRHSRHLLDWGSSSVPPAL